MATTKPTPLSLNFPNVEDAKTFTEQILLKRLPEDQLREVIHQIKPIHEELKKLVPEMKDLAYFEGGEPTWHLERIHRRGIEDFLTTVSFILINPDDQNWQFGVLDQDEDYNPNNPDLIPFMAGKLSTGHQVYIY